MTTIGDAATRQGDFFEAVCFAKERKLPVLFVVENNHYAQSTPVELELAGSIAGRAQAFGVETAELDTTDVEPLAHGIDVHNVFRDDVLGPSLPREKALANAPKRNEEGFLVPAVLE